MATKIVRVAYPAGLYLAPSYQNLLIEPTGSVGGAGVTASASQPSTITNLGTVDGTGNGIALADGGRIVNGGSGNATALLEGATAITIGGGAGVILNAATITSTPAPVGLGPYYVGPSIILNGGGQVSNTGTAALIGNGILASGAAAAVVNRGVIGGTYHTMIPPNSYGLSYDHAHGYSIQLLSGGYVNNGPNGSTSADIVNGVTVASGAATIINNGLIGTPRDAYYYYRSGYRRATSEWSVALDSGGSVTNGTGSNILATLTGGVSIGGAAGTVLNHGSIGAKDAAYKQFVSGEFDYLTIIGLSVALGAGGDVLNGTALAPSTMSGGIDISGGAGTISNYGRIGGPSSVKYDIDPDEPAYQTSHRKFDYSIFLHDGGVAVNGGPTAGTANISNGIEITGGTGIVTNDGTVGSPENLYHFSSYSTGDNSDAYGYSILLAGGGTVTNGSSTLTGAKLSSGVSIAGGGLLFNYGTIGGPSVQTDQETYHYSSTITSTYGYSVRLSGGGTIVNGGTSVSTAELRRGVRIVGGDGTIINFGTIDGIQLGAASDTWVEEGSGVVNGEVHGGGGTLVLGSATGAGVFGDIGAGIFSFATIEVQAGAGWRLVGPNVIDAGVTLSNASAIIDAGTITNDGIIDASAIVDMASGGVLDNQAGGSLYLVGDVGISPLAGAMGASFTNEGLLEKLAGGGTSNVRQGLADTGHIVVATGTLNLAGAINSIAGLVSGAGALELRLGSTTLQAGAALSVSSIELTGAGAGLTVATSLTYTHAFLATTGTTLTIGATKTLTLSGPVSLTGIAVGGAGRFSTKGTTTLAAVTLGGTAEWLNAGTVNATGKLTVGDAGGDKAVFDNEATGVFNITGPGGVAVGASTASQFTNAGILEDTAAGVSLVRVKVLNDGTVAAGVGTLELTGAVTGIGAFSIGAGAALEFANTVAAGQTATFTGAGGVLQLNANTGFAAKVSGFAAGEIIDLRGLKFAAGESVAYSGTTTAGTLTVGSGATSVKIALLGQYAAANFMAASDGQGGTQLGFVASPSALATPGH